MYIRVFYWTLALILIPILSTYAGLELSFSDTSPPSPLTDEVLPVGSTFTIDVIASAPVGSVAAVDFTVIWTPEDNVDYSGVSEGDFAEAKCEDMGYCAVMQSEAYNEQYIQWLENQLESKQSEWVSKEDAIRMIRFSYDKGIDWTNRHRIKNCMSADDVVNHLIPQKG